ncbi:SRPBCC family protein [Arthrobacter sp. zg-Y820]|uniref:SRPBCC family protein n=1 Tax=unclassified Arthrobacter TaxID=235627 RepID=UPI001E5D466F|nr:MULTISPECIES: SRPBCC family protein [unclassified Arthrobacter]MCC9195261.1 SRPBCC family protein [Arthrobacter sp. zg-Y820]MDK1278120.1 SRPBCC family protein [Arthrobacter sp. zg.Y820]MDK1361402.1 SRPBCC family protein [Arthrobacter sp. zg-Y1219]WIB10010.1 SRPBCC family protein [Arthrobacter sp. zg-Y820]
MSNPLTVHMPEGEPYVHYEREFDFAVHQVFQAHVDPELFAQWIGPREMTTRIDTFEPRTGGAYRFVQSGDDGVDYAFHGLFHTVREDDFVLQTFEYEGYPDSVTLEYATFTDLPGGRSKLTGRSVFPSVESRDGMASAGMEVGMSEGYDQLDELLGKGLSTG